MFKASFPHHTELITKSELNQKLGELVALYEKRAVETTENYSSVYFIILGLHRERNLRRADTGFKFSKADSGGAKSASEAEQLSKLCRDGSAHGIHLLIWCDTFSSFERVFQRNDIDEFGLRVALQISESDSRSFIDSDAANHLGSHRAIFFDDEKHGRLEKFRPYSSIKSEWLKDIAHQLRK
jgi:hypothetical protein